MERVVSVNLNGVSYQLDESAYDALRAYLGDAEIALAANPDKAEIIRDIEQAIADKCAAYLSAHKNVISAAEMRIVLEQMGPVEGDGEPRASTGEEGFSAPPRRLYRVRDRHSISGVSAGLAAYAQIDPTLVRAIWVIGTLITGGALAVIYVVLMFLMPPASTAEEVAEAYGAPFNAQEVIDRAKRAYSDITDETARAWRREQAARRHWRENARAPEPSKPIGYFMRIIAGLFAFIFSIITVALQIGFLVALFSLLSTGALFGWIPVLGAPIWLAIVIIAIVFVAVATPLGHLRRMSFATASGQRYIYDQRGSDAWVTLLAIFVGAMLAYHIVPEFRDWVEVWPVIDLDLLY